MIASARMETATPDAADDVGHARHANKHYAAHIALAMILALAALLRAWHLNLAGYGTQYYAAGVLSMLTSWHNFWFNSFDPTGFVSIDKPPLALWLQVGSAKLFGFEGWSIHLPQVIEGIAAVALLYYLVQRRFGRSAGLLSALFLAIMPISVAIDRSNNTDSCLVLGLLAAAWAVSIATEAGSRRMLLVSMALIGIAFNVKMLAAIVVVPPFMAVYLLGAPLPMSRKLAQLLLSAAILVVVSLLWCVSYDLTPAALRPYAGSTQTNSMLEMVIGENGIRRFVHRHARPVIPVSPGSPVPDAPSNPNSNALPAPAFGLRGGDAVPVGPLRLANPLLADQMGWLYPLAAAGVVASLWRRRIRLPLEPSDAALLLWVGWAVTYGLVLSYAGGIFHAYYLAAMTPPVCALAAIGLVRLWRWYREGDRRALMLPLMLIALAAWYLYIGQGYLASLQSNPQRAVLASAQVQAAHDLQHILVTATFVSALLAIAGLLLARLWRPLRSDIGSRGALALAMVAIVLTPAVWALGSTQSNGIANTPSAQLPDISAQRASRRTRAGSADPQLLQYLTSHYHDERYLLATLSAQQAAPIIIATGKSVMAIGGFSGADPILTPEKLNELVQQSELRFVLVGGGAGFATRASAQQTALVQWVQQHGSPVAPELWRSPQPAQQGAASAPNRRYGRGGGRGRGLNNDATAQLFDLRAEAAPTSGPFYEAPAELARVGYAPAVAQD
jgi:4-amino-4-deoxy-L-arabinose transferase-like glycosyltransferase